jgi:hypothetical protein
MGCLSLRVRKASSVLNAIGSSLVQTIFQQQTNHLVCAYCKYCADFRVSSGPLTDFNTLQPSGHYMYRTVVTICTVQWSLYVPPV